MIYLFSVEGWRYVLDTAKASEEYLKTIIHYANSDDQQDTFIEICKDNDLNATQKLERIIEHLEERYSILGKSQLHVTMFYFLCKNDRAKYPPLDDYEPPFFSVEI